MAFGGGGALRIEDRGRQMGQANSPMVAVDADRRHFVSLRLRIDAKLTGRAVVDLQSFTADGAVRGGARPVAMVLDKQGWVRVMRTLKPRDGATLVRIREVPAASGPAEHGTCWIDEVVLKPADEVTDVDLDLTRTTPGGPDRPTVRAGAAVRPLMSKPDIDFEDLCAWTLRHSRQMNEVSLDRSDWQRCEGDGVARLRYQTASAGQSVVLVPPEPVLIDRSFDTVTMWAFQHFYSFVTANVPWDIGPMPRVTIEDATGARHDVRLSRVVWQNWSVARARLPRTIEAPGRIVSIALDNLPACHDISGSSGEPVLAPRQYCRDALSCTVAGTRALDWDLPAPLPLTGPATLRPAPTGRVERRVGPAGDGYFFEACTKNQAVRFS